MKVKIIFVYFYLKKNYLKLMFYTYRKFKKRYNNDIIMYNINNIS